MNVLFFMAHPGHLRNFESTLRELADRGHRIRVAFDRDGDDPAVERLAQSIEATFGAAPEPEPRERWTLIAWQLRAMLDYLRYLGPPFEDAPRLRERAARQVPRALVRSLHSLGSRPRLRRLLSALERSVPPRGSVLRLLEEPKPDIVAVTPLLELGSPQLDYVRAAKSLRIPTCVCVASWDNLTNKGLLHELPDLVTVWNEAQRREAIDLHDVPPDRVVSTGAEAYDHWFGWRPSRSREEFCALVGLPADRQFVLYAGTSPFLAPEEGRFVIRWARQLRSKGASVLVRAHPLAPLSPVETAELEGIDGVRVWPPGGSNPVDSGSRADYFDSLFHAAAVVGLNTSAMIEAAIVGRPVLTVLEPEFADGQTRTLHFHHLLAANGGPAVSARSLDEHVEQLARALDGSLEEADLSGFVERFVRPFGLDRAAAPRLVDELELAAGKQVEALRPAPVPARVARPVLAAAGAIGLQLRGRRSR